MREPEDITGLPAEDRTDALIDRVIAGRGHTDGETDGLGRVAADLYALADVPLPIETRNRHLAAIHSHRIPQTPPRFTSLRRRVATFAAGATATFTLFGGGAVAAAQGAAPGDLLYGLDRATEQVRLALAGDAETEASIRLGLAQERLEEAERRPEHADGLIDEAVGHAEAAAAVQGANALAVLGELVAAKENPRAAQAIHEACLRIAERHGHDATPCGEAVELADDDAPGRSGEAPGRPGDAPGGTDVEGDDDRGAPSDAGDRGRSGEHRPDGAGSAGTDDGASAPDDRRTDRAAENRPEPPTGPQDGDQTPATTTGDDVDDGEVVDEESGDDGDGDASGPPEDVPTAGPPSDGPAVSASTANSRAAGSS